MVAWTPLSCMNHQRRDRERQVDQASRHPPPLQHRPQPRPARARPARSTRCTASVNNTAMIMITTRSSTTASVSRKARSDGGRCEPTTASTASANAMSVAAGIAQPAGWPLGADDVDDEVEQRRYGDPAQRGGDRHRRVGRPAQRADHELPLQLQPGHEEEQRQRAVGPPVLEIEGPELEADERVVRRVPRRVRPDQRDQRPHASASSPRPPRVRRRSLRNARLAGLRERQDAAYDGHVRPPTDPYAAGAPTGRCPGSRVRLARPDRQVGPSGGRSARQRPPGRVTRSPRSHGERTRPGHRSHHRPARLRRQPRHLHA